MDMISPDLLAILVCPETHQRLSLAPPELLARLTALQAEGKLVNRAGQNVTEPLQGALVREDGRVAYPVFEGIPVMLIDEGLLLEAAS
jgi:uncharacterized protein YbaR (Trm112 family)